ncbi:MAG TPA: acetyl-CoA carboxylase carboxyltransferase subunit alpha [Candidatus Limnocylindria bacterium]|jgi:acetyl-CoA carboxylase carboxyl transferase subunit alpha|nr:acetyl-CoA carboxylase carboxyltransferase subunit alpha [Candidatus Limnocylindria bacterium]
MSDVLPAGLEAMRDAAPSQEAIDAAWHRVQLARHPERPRTLDLVERIFEGFVELHGDRAFREDPAIVGGPALLDGRPVMIIGHQKGTDTDSNIFRNFGSPHPEGFRKAQRLMRLAEKLAMPVITFLDTAGAFPGPAAEERGQAEAIASSIKLMTGLQVPILVVIVGEGGSGGALAIGVGDVVLAMENAVYAVISPEGCASILWRDPEKAPIAAAAMRMTAADQMELGVIDGIIDEPKDGAQADPGAAARAIKAALLAALARIGQASPEALLTSRYARLRAIGLVIEAPGEHAPAVEPVTLRRRIGRVLRLPGVPRPPRWSEIWPSGDDDASENDA